MSTENNPNPQQESAPKKGRQPDFIIHDPNSEANEGSWEEIGGAWQVRNGYLKTKIDMDKMPKSGELIFQPRVQLEKLREQRKAQQTEQQKSRDISQTL